MNQWPNHSSVHLELILPMYKNWMTGYCLQCSRTLILYTSSVLIGIRKCEFCQKQNPVGAQNSPWTQERRSDVLCINHFLSILGRCGFPPIVPHWPTLDSWRKCTFRRKVTCIGIGEMLHFYSYYSMSQKNGSQAFDENDLKMYDIIQNMAVNL